MQLSVMLFVPVHIRWLNRSTNALPNRYHHILSDMFCCHSYCMDLGSNMYGPLLFVQHFGFPVLNKL